MQAQLLRNLIHCTSAAVFAAVIATTAGDAPALTVPLNQGLSFQDEGTMEFDDTVKLAVQDGNWAPTPTGTVTMDAYATGGSSTWFDAVSANFDLAAAGIDFQEIITAELRFFIRNGDSGAWTGQESYQVLQGFKNPTNEDSSPTGTSFNLPTGAWVTEPLNTAWFTSNSFDVTLRLWEAQVDAIELQLGVVPEPSTGAILLVGLAGWLGIRRRRRAA